MNRTHTTVLTILTALLLGCACSDPSDKVHKSAAAEPKSAAPTSVKSGKEYAIRAGSTISFSASKVTRTHQGGFKKFAGTLSVADGKLADLPEIKVAIPSIWTDDDRLTGHLKSPDFFDAKQFPVATFTATVIVPSGAQSNITGNLELHGVKKSITFPADISVSDSAVTVKAEFAINRRDFNINYPGMPNDLIRDNVVIKLDINATPGPARPEDQLSI